MTTPTEHESAPEAQRTPQQHLFNALLTARTGQSLDQIVLEQRRNGVSWEKIARHVDELLNGEVSTTGVTLFRWYRDTDTGDAA